jgi:peptidoglycan/xylan/chitin deacetylase (PgdA/CDA1 family)
MLRQAKLVLLESIRVAGVMRLISGTAWRRRKLLILCYHGISMADEHLWNPALFVPPEHLEKRLRTLREGKFNVLGLGEAVERLQRNDLPPKAVVLTFDDGLADFYYKAFPLLQEFEMPATVYLSTYYCFNNIPVFSVMIRYVIWRARQLANPEANPAIGWNTAQDLNTSDGRAGAARCLDHFAEQNHLSGAEKEILVASLARHLQVDYDSIRRSRVLTLMRPEQVKEIHDAGVTIELHTHRHRTPREVALFTREIEENREKIISITGRSPQHFCYPSGVWRTEMLPVLGQSGVLTATTCEPGLATGSTSPLLLPRHIDTASQSAAEFEGWLSGVSQFLPRRSQPREG